MDSDSFRPVLIWVSPGEELSQTRLEGNRLSLGRDEGNEIRLSASGVSRRHAELSRRGPLWVLADSGSTNGVHLNRRRITQAPLANGHVIRLGDAVAVVAGGLGAGSPPSFGKIAEGLYAGSRFSAQLAEVLRIAAFPLTV